MAGPWRVVVADHCGGGMMAAVVPQRVTNLPTPSTHPTSHHLPRPRHIPPPHSGLIRLARCVFVCACGGEGEVLVMFPVWGWVLTPPLSAEASRLASCAGWRRITTGGSGLCSPGLEFSLPAFF